MHVQKRNDFNCKYHEYYVRYLLKHSLRNEFLMKTSEFRVISDEHKVTESKNKTSFEKYYIANVHVCIYTNHCIWFCMN